MKLMNELVTVIVPAYNVEKYLSDCIESILRQTYSNIEIIIIDDGSSDSTFRIAKKCSSSNKNIVAITQENKGVSEARNAGLYNSHGRYVAFIDADDIYEPTFIADQVRAIKNSDIAVAGMNIVAKKNSRKLPKRRSEKNMTKALFCDEGVGGFVWNKLYKKEIIVDNNLKFDNRYTILEDLIFNINYLKCAKTVKIVRKPSYNYYQRKGSATRKSLKILTEEMLKSLCYTKRIAPINLKKDVDFSIVETKIKGGYRLSANEYGIFLRYLLDVNYSAQRKAKTVAKKVMGRIYRKKWENQK